MARFIFMPDQNRFPVYLNAEYSKVYTPTMLTTARAGDNGWDGVFLLLPLAGPWRYAHCREDWGHGMPSDPRDVPRGAPSPGIFCLEPTRVTGDGNRGQAFEYAHFARDRLSPTSRPHTRESAQPRLRQQRTVAFQRSLKSERRRVSSIQRLVASS